MTATEGGSPTVDDEGARALGSSYAVFERIGRGATGVVHRGLDRRTGDVVAVKVLRPELASDAAVVERFLRERAILTRLADPHTVGLRDLVVEGDTVALVTDYVDGGDLRALLGREGPLPVEVAVDLAAQILDGLAAAHERGVVHCDLKPENVLVTRVDDGLLARVTDFGIATLLRGAPSDPAPSLVGSPDYMAPEVVEGRALTPAADLYGTGIVLYELLSGRTPFAGGPAVAVLRRHVEEPPLRLPDVPGAVWNQIVTLLAKDPRRRPPSARVAAARLRAALSSETAAGTAAADPADVEVDDARPRRENESPTYVPHTPPRGATPRDQAPGRERSAARARRAFLAGAAVVVVAAGAAAIAAALASRGRSTSTPHVRLTTAPVLQSANGSNVVVTRTWDLSGRDGDHVKVTVRLRNAGTRPVLSFDELPLESGQHRQITTFDLDLGPGDATTISYTRAVPAGALDVRRIENWEGILDPDFSVATARLADADARPAVLTLARGQHAFLNVAGVTTAGSVASGELLDGLTWASSDTHVARVQPGTRADWRPVVDARSAGAAVLSARLGTRTLRVDVVVGSRAVPAAGTRLPCEPGIGQPADLVDVRDGAAFTAGDGNVTIVAGGARVAAFRGTAESSVATVDPRWLATLPATPRDGTLLREGGGQLWLVVDGARLAVSDADVAALGLDPTRATPVPQGSISVPVLGSVGAPGGALARRDGSPAIYVSNGHGWTETSRACSAKDVPTVPAGTDLPATLPATSPTT